MSIRPYLAYTKLSVKMALDPNAGPMPLADYISLYPKWRAGQDDKRSPIDMRIPWMTYRCIAFLEKIVMKDWKIFEYGSGGSTLFFAERCGELVSVEHDAEWGKAVHDAVVKGKFDAVDHQVIESVKASIPAGADPSNPADFISSDKNYIGCSFEDYARAIDRFPDDYFDLVIVDGRARPSCLTQAKSKVKPGGRLLLDNAERVHYQPAQRSLGSLWSVKKFGGPVPANRYFCTTRMWQRTS